MTTVAAHPTQVRLTGQTCVADGPHDLTGMYVMHRAFRRDLDRFAAAVAATPAEDVQVWRALHRRWNGFRERPAPPPPRGRGRGDLAAAAGAGHRRRARCPGGDGGRAREHRPAARGLASGFSALAEGSGPEARTALDVRVTAARESLLRHLEHEETQALPLVQARMSVEAWAAAEKAAGGHVRLRELPFIVPWVSDGLSRDEWDRTVGQGGAVVRRLHVLLRRRYAARERVAFRYA